MCRPTSRSMRRSPSRAASWCTTSTASGRAEWLEGGEDSPELRRARVLRPVVAAADHILDIHSTGAGRWRRSGSIPATRATRRRRWPSARPDVHLVMPKGLDTGTPLIQHGAPRRSEEGTGVALVAECGQHFLRATADMAVGRGAALPGALRADRRDPATPTPPRPQRRFELLRTCVVKTRELPLRAAAGGPGDVRARRADRDRRRGGNPRAVRRLHGVHAHARADRRPRGGVPHAAAGRLTTPAARSSSCATPAGNSWPAAPASRRR